MLITKLHAEGRPIFTSGEGAADWSMRRDEGVAFCVGLLGRSIDPAALTVL